MDMFTQDMQLIKRLNQPFPDRASDKQSLKTFLGVGVFVCLFLFVLNPFSFDGEWSARLALCALFGLVTVVFGWGYDQLTTKVFKLKTYGPSWTLWKWILSSLGLIVFIAMGNIIAVALLFGYSWMDSFFMLHMFGNTLLIGIFPLTISGLVVQLNAAKSFAAEAKELSIPEAKDSQKSKEVKFTTDSGEEVIIDLTAFRYAEAMQNYVAVYSLKDGELEKTVHRLTIKNLEISMSDTEVIRCHRSYLVNLKAIESVKGNAQGLKLNLTHVQDTFVPVSRTYIPAFKAKFSANS